MKDLKSIALMIGSLMAGFTALAQTPSAADLLQRLNGSPIVFETDIDPSVQAEPHPQVTSNYYHQVNSEEGISLRLYKLSPPDSMLFEDAEIDYSKGRYEKAREKYESVLKHHPEFAVAMVFTGQTHGINGNDEEARDWYLKAIETNYTDWMAHWFLAETYSNLDMMDDAVHEICIAAVLNRNHQKIRAAREDIFRKARMKLYPWELDLHYKLEFEAGKSASVSASDSVWLKFGMAEALWRADTAFRHSEGGTASPFFFKEVRNCLNILMDTYRAEKRLKRDQILALEYMVAINDGGLLDEFILHEVWLRRYPVMIYSLTKEEIEELAEYHQLTRSTKFEKVRDLMSIFRG